MLNLSDFSYQLPPERIAHAPLARRDHSKLLLVDRHLQRFSDHLFYDLPQLLQPGDVLVRNNTKVIPVKLVGHKPTGGEISLLLIKRDAHFSEEVWECLSKPGIKLGQIILFPQGVTAECVKIDGYSRWLKFTGFSVPFLTILQDIGATPIPPYIHSTATEKELRLRYQTIYAKFDGSAAAPTAGLHFTPELDAQLLEKGIAIEEVTLHVGLGTFAPVRTDQIANHQLHSEWYELSPATAQKLNIAKANRQRIIAVGTTTTRVLETCAKVGQKSDLSSPPSQETNYLEPGSGETTIFIHPPYQFKFVDGLITNFHLPESTLLMLISAFASQPTTPLPFSTFHESLLGQAYQHAIDQEYRFFSFGDAMLIV